MQFKNTLFLGLALLSSTSLPAQKKTRSYRAKAFEEAEQLKGFTLPEGFVIELVASEDNGLINPIDLTFDDAGRLWTQTAVMYPLDPVAGLNFRKTLSAMTDPDADKKYPQLQKVRDLYTLKKRGDDKILIIEDPTQRAQGPLRVWADGLAIPQSIYPYKDGCFVAHGSEFFFLDDTNKDGKQDKVETLMSGFGIFDTHTMAHSIVRGPGGWLYFSHGALNSGLVTLPKTGQELKVTYAKNLRAKLDGSELEIVGTAKDNVWGYQIRSNGQWYSTSANDAGLSVLPTEEMTGISGIGGDSIRQYQPLLKNVHDFRVGGTGISGLAFSEDGDYGFPAVWKDIAFLANPINNSISCVKITRDSSGKVDAKLHPEFLKCQDDWFRPVNIEFGPDGCLYIADWYNKIISHNEISTRHPDRDRKHGRIWRVRHKDQKAFAIPNIAKAPNSSLLKHLNGRTLWEKRAAWQQIVDRKAIELTPELEKLALDTSSHQSVRILAIWSINGLGQHNEQVFKELIATQDQDVAREAIRALGTSTFTPEQVATLIGKQIEANNAMVRSQSIRTLEELGQASPATIDLLVTACKPAASNNLFGQGYERNFERFLARKALETYTAELSTYLQSSATKAQAPERLLWALQALPKDQVADAFLKNWEQASQNEIDDNTFISITKLLSFPKIKAVFKKTFEPRADVFLELALKNKSHIDGPALSQFYISKIDKMFKSGDEKEVKKALSLVDALRSPHHVTSISALLNDKNKTRLHPAAISNLAHTRGNHTALYQTIAVDKDYTFSTRLHAMGALAIKNNKEAPSVLLGILPTLSEQETSQVVNRLSYSKEGSTLLSFLQGKKAIQSKHWDFASSERAAKFLKKNKPMQSLFTAFSGQENAEKIRLSKKAEHYFKSTAKLTGNPDIGKALFGSCLGCHAVQGEGQELAPPLDGSAARDRAHLITAIVSPDEAMESAFGLSYAVRNDGFAAEGYLLRSDDDGVIIASPGGAQTFIAKSALIGQGNVSGRSFMPRTFGNLPDQTMADLLSYIKTLK